MRVVVCANFAPLDQLVVEERPAPACGERDVRIAVTAAGVNFVDGLFVQGLYQIKPPLPFVPGNEIAGRVTEVGAQVSGFAIGDRVFANVGLGGYASEVVLDARRIRHTPETMTDGQAATFSQSYMTAWFALHQRARAESGQWLLVLGAGGGVGLAAVDVGRAMGLRVIAAASTDEKLAICREHGADATINYEKEDLREAIKRETGGKGPDVIYDPVGGKFAEPAFRSIGWRGRYLVIGFANGQIPALPLNLMLLKGASVVGVFWGEFTKREPAANAAGMAEMLEWLAQGKLRPHISGTYRLDQVAQALNDMSARKVTGKILIVP
jgi:NADPH2:quinone reductase